MKNYNKELLNALHSVFWYEGLLDQENDEWLDFKRESDGDIVSRPKYTSDCVILKLIDELRNKPTVVGNSSPSVDNFYTQSDVELLEPEFSNYVADKETHTNLSKGRYNCIWQMLVEMFGSCGTSPRTGWIEQRKECADFLEQVVCIEELYFLER